ncbi:response regulator [Mucilaginibacter sp. KACC 22063]|uniref:response regulator n=1 Tax=Mucilaginibacter sp. KACC 22063 TaxID=3025666 RepID=UPI002365BE8C|nr:response regulator [Mucilaginibacter sp. KACC 22063]WDF54839.1 response regulator [Mucilaginibacter sp. KACC 22063]
MIKVNKLCVIDDDEIYTFTVKRLIKQTGAAEETLFFENGQMAIDHFVNYQHQPDMLPEVILLDLNMPVLDGWQFLDQFTQLVPAFDKSITVYIVSSSIDEADYIRAKAIREVSDFIVKPVNADTLRNLVGRLNAA